MGTSLDAEFNKTGNAITADKVADELRALVEQQRREKIALLKDTPAVQAFEELLRSVDTIFTRNDLSWPGPLSSAQGFKACYGISKSNDPFANYSFNLERARTQAILDAGVTLYSNDTMSFNVRILGDTGGHLYLMSPKGGTNDQSLVDFKRDLPSGFKTRDSREVPVLLMRAFNEIFFTYNLPNVKAQAPVKEEIASKLKESFGIFLRSLDPSTPLAVGFTGGATLES